MRYRENPKIAPDRKGIFDLFPVLHDIFDRGEGVIAGAASDKVESDVRRYLTV